MSEAERNWQQVARDMRAIVDARCVIDDRETLSPYECDGLSVYREMPRLVVIPDSVDEVRAVMAYCYRSQVPVVVRGAGTSLSAGAMPHADGIVLSMAKFTRIIEIDPASRLARVECGVRNLAISEAAAPHGLYYAPDPSSQIACTIGGNVAENSGGVHCLKYGLTVHNVLQATLVTVEGERLTVGSEGLDSCGMDLMALLTGSEGLLGVVTDVTVKLLPRPQVARVVLGAFDDVERAGEAVSGVIGAGIIPAGLEMMDHLAIVAAEDYVQAGYPLEAQALLLCELDGSEAEVEESTRRVADLLRAHGATAVRVSQTDAERELLWKGRKSAFPAIGRISPDYYCMDGTIPRHQLAVVLREMQRMSEHFGLRVANVFHAGDGNLHPLILFDESVPGELERAEAFGAAILELCVRVGGCITGEHGVGMEKIRQMPLQFSEAELTQLGLIKLAFDGGELLNPGKGIPILRRCQEYRSLDLRAASRVAIS
ncbi:MAG TPA: FAD-linked oxidase C-terminal domain-containing protein [Xanthomonadales bacterium]|nr:FAD-linked oxidase C-terminal domain-containing protein [Xanthomonadales bacterium]